MYERKKWLSDIESLLALIEVFLLKILVLTASSRDAVEWDEYDIFVLDEGTIGYEYDETYRRQEKTNLNCKRHSISAISLKAHSNGIFQHKVFVTIEELNLNLHSN